MSQEFTARISKRKFKDPSSHPFEIKIKGKTVKGFAVFKGGKYYAYLNLCKHLPVTLDLEDGKFFTHDLKNIQCHLHGATYEIETGFCFEGPCQGASLDKLRIEVTPENIIIYIPKELAD